MVVGECEGGCVDQMTAQMCGLSNFAKWSWQRGKWTQGFGKLEMRNWSSELGKIAEQMVFHTKWIGVMVKKTRWGLIRSCIDCMLVSPCDQSFQFDGFRPGLDDEKHLSLNLRSHFKELDRAWHS